MKCTDFVDHNETTSARTHQNELGYVEVCTTAEHLASPWASSTLTVLLEHVYVDHTIWLTTAGILQADNNVADYDDKFNNEQWTINNSE